MVRPLDESEGSSPLQGHGSWLMCEVALISYPPIPTSTYRPQRERERERAGSGQPKVLQWRIVNVYMYNVMAERKGAT